MNITKEQMLERIREWKGAFDTHPDKMDEWSLCFMEDYKVYDAIRSLIESSGEKAVPASDRLTVQYANAPTIKKDLTVGPSAMDEGSIGAIESARELVSPAPLPKEVEEALLNLGNVLTDAYDLAWEGETGEEKYANAQTALAVIRAALSKGIEVEP